MAKIKVPRATSYTNNGTRTRMTTGSHRPSRDRDPGETSLGGGLAEESLILRIGRVMGRWIIYPTILVAAVLLIGYGLHKHRILDPPPELRPGQRLEALQIAGRHHETLEMTAGEWYLLVSGPVGDLDMVKYLSRLMDAPALGAERLRPIVLIDGHHEALKEFEMRNFLAFPVNALHSFRHEDLLDLGLRGHEPAYALISPELEIVFASTYLQANDVRLLLEKHLGTQPAQNIRPVHAGDDFPSIDSAQVAGPNLDSTPIGAATTWVIFTAQCVSCSFANRMEDLARSGERLQAWSSERDTSLAVMFGDSFDEPNVVGKAAQLGLTRFPIYMARSPLHGFEDPYLRSSLHDEDVLIVQADAKGVVVDIWGFSSFLTMLDRSSTAEGVSS